MIKKTITNGIEAEKRDNECSSILIRNGYKAYKIRSHEHMKITYHNNINGREEDDGSDTPEERQNVIKYKYGCNIFFPAPHQERFYDSEKAYQDEYFITIPSEEVNGAYDQHICGLFVDATTSAKAPYINVYKDIKAHGGYVIINHPGSTSSPAGLDLHGTRPWTYARHPDEPFDGYEVWAMANDPYSEGVYKVPVDKRYGDEYLKKYKPMPVPEMYDEFVIHWQKRILLWFGTDIHDNHAEGLDAYEFLNLRGYAWFPINADLSEENVRKYIFKEQDVWISSGPVYMEFTAANGTNKARMGGKLNISGEVTFKIWLSRSVPHLRIIKDGKLFKEYKDIYKVEIADIPSSGFHFYRVEALDNPEDPRQGVSTYSNPIYVKVMS